MNYNQKPVWGAKSISKYIDVPPRKGFYLLEKGLVPARKKGKIWQSTEGELDDFLLGRTTTTPTGEAA
jgi:hypothetical protein